MHDEEFKSTVYEFRVEEKSYSLEFSSNNSEFVSEVLEKFKIESFGIVTAYNPNAKIQSEKDNIKANLLLAKEIRTLKLDFFYGLNIDKKNEWPNETSFLIWPINEENLRSIGQKFEQVATIIGNKKGELKLIYSSP
jgi:hypothetical protein